MVDWIDAPSRTNAGREVKETDFDDDDGDLSDRSRESKLVPPPAPPQLLLLPAAPAAALRRVTAIALGEIERERKTQLKEEKRKLSKFQVGHSQTECL